MADLSDVSSIIQNSLLLTSYGINSDNNKLQTIQEQLKGIISVLDKDTLTKLTNSAEDKLATAKAFVSSMKANGMSNQSAVKTYVALQKYSLMSSFGNYNFVNAKV